MEPCCREWMEGVGECIRQDATVLHLSGSLVRPASGVHRPW